jgi:hypothetical protein
MNLKEIAETLRMIAETTGGPVQHKDKDTGLTITLQADLKTGMWTLSLTKLYRQASEQEREECKRAFGVPKDHDWTPLYRNGWGIIRYTWLEKQAEQLTIEGLGDEQQFNNYSEDILP